MSLKILFLLGLSNRFFDIYWCHFIETCQISADIQYLHILKYNFKLIFVFLQQSFTSNWPKTLWLAVDQRGVHLLEFRSRNVLTSFEYDSILDYTPSLNHMLLITGNDKKQSKIIVNTNQV